MFRKKSGFTLVELAVAMAVSGLCIVLTLGAWVRFRAATLHREQRALELMECELRFNVLYNKWSSISIKRAEIDSYFLNHPNGPWRIEYRGKILRVFGSEQCPSDTWVDLPIRLH